ncbi:2-oxo-tetronate isomerase [Trichonephila clavata]|uniref:Putative hydroxypyruvate isomerase n=1 Tax=Trichonephila clavata TaxID=2740835 RepID=A0A8X6LR02_TRICU|nr:2-oxo-tetronate isomerase [Trichonephila clavata]
MAEPIPNLKFAANLSTMFQDLPFCQRFEAARKKGFKAVEAQFLYDYDVSALRNAKMSSGLEMVLINSPVGDMDTFGLASVPGQEVSFITSIQQATVYAVATDCKKVHIMAGIKQANDHEDDIYKIYVNNLRVGVEMLEEYNISAVIEPICPEVKENYFLDSFAKALKVIAEINSPNLELLLDFYHMHMMGLTPDVGIPLCINTTGHVQISQAPNRIEPFAPGPIDYDITLELLQTYKYKGYIGLEYKPSDPVKGFDWLHLYGF